MPPRAAPAPDVGLASDGRLGPDTRLAGVDGCRGGWLVCRVAATGPLRAEIGRIDHFAALLAAPDAPAIVAVDMPIGLPDHVGPDGRGPERAIRPLLGPRRASVFSLPSRAAVWAGDGRLEPEAWRLTCATALATSTPPRKVSIQGFNLFAKIRELDRLMTPDLARRVFESHPELAFTRLNGDVPMAAAKKGRRAGDTAGLDQRRMLLLAHGFDAATLDARPPRGAGRDDVFDACVLALVARRIAAATARSWPEIPAIDARGLPMAIWA